MPVETDEDLRDILALETVAVIGASTTTGKAAHDIPRYLMDHGYDVIPVNPTADEVLGRPAADSLPDVDTDVDIVDVFRPSEEVPGIADQVLERPDVDTLWLQRGIQEDEAATRVEESGRRVVQDRCMKVEHRRLLR